MTSLLCLTTDDDLHLSVNMRGGPERWQVTGWLQVIEMKKDHEGDFTCIAQNDLGVAKASARLKVVTEQGQCDVTVARRKRNCRLFPVEI